MAKKSEIEENVGTGRRKTAVASVRVRAGSGKIDVNGRSFEDYFPLEVQRSRINIPIEFTKLEGKLDLLIRVKGGGLQAQVDAVLLGLARALVERNESFHQDFKNLGILTRDPRKKERKKYGQPGARKRFQFSKR